MIKRRASEICAALSLEVTRVYDELDQWVRIAILFADSPLTMRCQTKERVAKELGVAERAVHIMQHAVEQESCVRYRLVVDGLNLTVNCSQLLVPHPPALPTPHVLHTDPKIPSERQQHTMRENLLVAAQADGGMVEDVEAKDDSLDVTGQISVSSLAELLLRLVHGTSSPDLPPFWREHAPDGFEKVARPVRGAGCVRSRCCSLGTLGARPV
jgi:hypothetical protein